MIRTSRPWRAIFSKYPALPMAILPSRVINKGGPQCVILLALSTGLELSNNKSPNLGLATKAVPFDASLLPQQSVSSGPVETTTRVSNPFGRNRGTSSSTFPTGSTDNMCWGVGLPSSEKLANPRGRIRAYHS